jgi:peptidoglycan/LPS O-acetylase OafA/YrhL
MKRNYTIDFLRFIAITLVILSHTSFNNPSNFVHRIMSPGFLGVDLFFVLSGFLVSGLIITEFDKYKSFKPKLFLIRRGFKIYPTYYIFLLSASAYQLISHKFSLKGFLCDFFFLSNYTNYSGRAWFWSLSLEEHFYLIICILFFLLIKYNRFSWKSIFTVYLSFLTISFLWRLFNYFHYSEIDFRRDITMTHGRLDSLFVGVLLYYSYYYKNGLYKFIIANGKLLFTLSLILILSNYTDIRQSRIVVLSLLSLNSIFFGIIIVYLLSKESINDNYIIRKLSYIGRYSYPIYVIGFPIEIFPKLNAIMHTNNLTVCLGIVLVFLPGIFFSKIVEAPFIKMRDKYFPSRSKSLI